MVACDDGTDIMLPCGVNFVHAQPFGKKLLTACHLLWLHVVLQALLSADLIRRLCRSPQATLQALQQHQRFNQMMIKAGCGQLSSTKQQRTAAASSPAAGAAATPAKQVPRGGVAAAASPAAGGSKFVAPKVLLSSFRLPHW
jgi:hypothetical protein